MGKQGGVERELGARDQQISPHGLEKNGQISSGKMQMEPPEPGPTGGEEWRRRERREEGGREYGGAVLTGGEEWRRPEKREEGGRE